MTTQRPVENARCWFTNAADRAVEIYVDYHDEPHVTVEPGEDKPAFAINSDADRIYGTYTFEIRQEGKPDGEVLAAASVAFEEGEDYTAVFFPHGSGDYQLSVYGTDYSPTGASRLVVHHVALPERVDWRIAPNAKADERVPSDERAGTLARGQYQQAIDVTPNRYRLEVLVDGEVVAHRRDLALEPRRMVACYVVGDPEPGMNRNEKESHVVGREYQIEAGPGREDETTSPADPLSTADTNRTIEFAVDPVEVYETNPAETEIGATDPDGIVADLGIDAVEPPTDGFLVRDESVDRAATVGGTTTATLQVTPAVPPGSYDVRVVSNPESPGEQVTAVVPVAVEPVTVERLRDLVTQYNEAGDATDAVAEELQAALSDAERFLEGGPDPCASLTDGIRGLIERYERTDTVSQSVIEDLRAVLDAYDPVPTPGDTQAACDALRTVITIADRNKEKGIGDTAVVDLRTETEALRARLGCT